MEAREAVARAKQTIKDLFSDEGITNVGLEEIVQKDDEWEITIGFSRPWDSIRDAQSIITGVPTLERSFKKVSVSGGKDPFVRVVNR